MTQVDASTFTVLLPEGATHYVVNLIDENQFLVSYPSATNFTGRRFDWKTVALQAHSQ